MVLFSLAPFPVATLRPLTSKAREIVSDTTGDPWLLILPVTNANGVEGENVVTKLCFSPTELIIEEYYARKP